MKHPQSDGKRASRMRRGEKILHLVGVEAQALADHLDELPKALATIDSMEDEIRRREGEVAVREALRGFRRLHWQLQLAIAKLTELNEPLETSDPSASRHTDDGRNGDTARQRWLCSRVCARDTPGEADRTAGNAPSGLS